MLKKHRYNKILGGVVLISLILLPMMESVLGSNRSNDCYPLFKGTPGCHGWFISPLIVTFIFNPENITEIQSWQNGSWVPYDGPFNITENGELPLFKWRYRTIENGGEWIYDQCYCQVKTDFDKPSVYINIERKGFFFFKKYIVTAIASDNTSGMDYVEFYLNGQLQFNDTEMPFEWTLKPVPHGQNLTFKVCAYDVAGNYGNDQAMQPNVYSNSLPRNATLFPGIFYLIKKLILLHTL